LHRFSPAFGADQGLRVTSQSPTGYRLSFFLLFFGLSDCLIHFGKMMSRKHAVHRHTSLFPTKRAFPGFLSLFFSRPPLKRIVANPDFKENVVVFFLGADFFIIRVSFSFF